MPIEIGRDGSPIVKPTVSPNPVSPVSPIKPVGAIPPNPPNPPSNTVDPTTIAIQKQEILKEAEKDRNSIEGTKESEKEMIARLEREAKGQAVPVPSTAPNILTMSVEKKELLRQIQLTLLEYDNKESEIPHSNAYWDHLNRFRSIK